MDPTLLEDDLHAEESANRERADLLNRLASAESRAAAAERTTRAVRVLVFLLFVVCTAGAFVMTQSPSYAYRSADATFDECLGVMRDHVSGEERKRATWIGLSRVLEFIDLLQSQSPGDIFEVSARSTALSRIREAVR